MDSKIRLGVIGYGHRGQGMFRIATESFEGVEGVAICEKNPELLSKAAGDYPDCQTFTDFEKMLDSVEMDALLVETPAVNHAEFCIKGLQRNIHVMSDIPCVDNVEEAWEFWGVEKKSDSIFMTGANPNMWAFVDSAVDLKGKGLLGDPYYMEAEYLHCVESLFESTPWRETYEGIKYCTHSLGPLLRLIDEDLEYVSCFDTGSHINKKPGQHDAMVAIFKTSSNVAIRLLVSFINHYPGCIHNYRVFGTKGYFERFMNETKFWSTEMYTDKELIKIPIDLMRPEYVGKASAQGHGGADYALFDRFFQAIRDRALSPISLQEGLRMSLPGIYAAESARKGGELIKIKYPWSS